MLPLQPGSIVVGRYVDNWYEVKDGTTYIVVSANDGIVYKRVFNQIDDTGNLVLRSDNPSYPPYTIPVEDVLEVWEASLHLTYANKGMEYSYQQIIQVMQELKGEVSKLKKADDS